MNYDSLGLGPRTSVVNSVETSGMDLTLHCTYDPSGTALSYELQFKGCDEVTCEDGEATKIDDAELIGFNAKDGAAVITTDQGELRFRFSRLVPPRRHPKE